MGILLGKGQDLGEIRQVDRHAQRMGHLVVGHLGQDLGHPGGKFGKIDVAVGVDVHPGIVNAR